MEPHTTKRSGLDAWQFLQDYGPTALIAGALDDATPRLAAELAKGGFDLVLVADNTKELEPLAARLRDHEGVAVTLLHCQPDIPAELSRIADACAELDVGSIIVTTTAMDASRLQQSLKKQGHKARQLEPDRVFGH